MKTVKFKDLPEKVLEFCNRIGYAWIGNIVDTEWLHTKADWSKATDEERLAYAEWRYKKGISYIPIRGGVVSVVSNGEMLVFNNDCLHESLNGESIINEADCYNLVYDGKWAEIISEPKKEEPTFKAGDEVEVRIKDWSENEWRNRIYGCFLFDSHWCRFKDDNYLFKFDEIRKPDPDKVYREMAMEFLHEKVYSFENLEQFMMLKQGLIELTTEAIKKVKEL